MSRSSDAPVVPGNCKANDCVWGSVCEQYVHAGLGCWARLLRGVNLASRVCMCRYVVRPFLGHGGSR